MKTAAARVAARFQTALYLAICFLGVVVVILVLVLADSENLYTERNPSFSTVMQLFDRSHAAGFSAAEVTRLGGSITNLQCICRHKQVQVKQFSRVVVPADVDFCASVSQAFYACSADPQCAASVYVRSYYYAASLICLAAQQVVNRSVTGLENRALYSAFMVSDEDLKQYMDSVVAEAAAAAAGDFDDKVRSRVETSQPCS